MLENLKLGAIFVVLLICAKFSEQSLGQGHSKKSLQQHPVPATSGSSDDRSQADELRKEQLKVLRQRKAQEMKKYMNLQANFCNDFYEFGCGNWLQYQNTSNINVDERWSVNDVLERQLLLEVKALINGPSPKSAEYDDTMMKHFYRSCLQASASSNQQKEFIKKFVEYYGGLPYLRDSRWDEKQYSWIDVIAQLKHRYNLDILITFTIPRATVGRAIPIPILEEPKKTILPTQLCSYLADHEIDGKDEIFNDIQEEIRNNLRAWLDLEEPDTTRLAGDILRFEFELCKYMRKPELMILPTDLMNKTRTHYNKIVPNRFHGVMQNLNYNQLSLSTLEERYSLEFTRFVQISLGKGPAVPRDFYFRDEDYFKHLNNIARKGLTASFAYYIMYRALSEMTLPRYLPKSEKPLYCTRKTLEYFPHILGGLYQAKFRSDQTLHDLREIFKHVRKAFAESVDSNTYWLEDSYRRDMILRTHSWKIKEPEFRSGSDPVNNVNLDTSGLYWKSLESVMEHNAQLYLQQLSTSNSGAVKQHLQEFAFIDSTNVETRLQISWALLQEPFYSPDYPNSLKYSSVGFIMAREMVKHYDQQGWHDGMQPIVNPWNDDVLDRFEYIKECFRIQVSNYLYNKPNVYRNATQLREVVVDTSALNIAFAAYIKWLDNQDANDEELLHETLPDMDFSNTQLFFINYAQSHCAGRRLKDAAATSEYFPMARHTLERLAINGPLANSYEMGRDFNCPIGSNMNLDDKCLAF